MFSELQFSISPNSSGIAKWLTDTVDRYTDLMSESKLLCGHVPHISVMINHFLFFVVLPFGSEPGPQPMTEECAYLNDVIDVAHGEDHDCWL